MDREVHLSYATLHVVAIIYHNANMEKGQHCILLWPVIIECRMNVNTKVHYSVSKRRSRNQAIEKWKWRKKGRMRNCRPSICILSLCLWTQSLGDAWESFQSETPWNFYYEERASKQ